jgi:hypothetical protein
MTTPMSSDHMYEWVGRYLEEVDPEMFDRLVDMIEEKEDAK